MLSVIVPIGPEEWDEKNEEFVVPKTKTLLLEHSLVSLSKWESNWCKPFLSSSDKTNEETLDYIKCMTITQNVDPDIYNYLTPENISQINQYIYAPMTATTFREDKVKKTNSQIITSELVYSWMVALNIPFECQKWHLNRLLTLIRVCEVNMQPPKKMSKQDVMSRNAALNAARKRQFNTTG